MVLSQAKQAATATVRGLLYTESGSPTAEVVAPLIRDLILRIETVVAITGLSKPSIYRLISEKSFPNRRQLCNDRRVAVVAVCELLCKSISNQISHRTL